MLLGIGNWWKDAVADPRVKIANTVSHNSREEQKIKKEKKTLPPKRDDDFSLECQNYREITFRLVSQFHFCSCANFKRGKLSHTESKERERACSKSERGIKKKKKFVRPLRDRERRVRLISWESFLSLYKRSFGTCTNVIKIIQIYQSSILISFHSRVSSHFFRNFFILNLFHFFLNFDSFFVL